MIQGLKAEELLKVGKLYKDRTDFDQALPYLIQASDLFLQENNFDKFLDSQNVIIRIYAESEGKEKANAFAANIINEIKEII